MEWWYAVTERVPKNSVNGRQPHLRLGGTYEPEHVGIASSRAWWARAVRLRAGTASVRRHRRRPGTRARGQLHADRADLAVDLGGPRWPRSPPHYPGARGFRGRRGVGLRHNRRRRRPGGLWSDRLVPRRRSRRLRRRRSPQPRPEAELAEPRGSCRRPAGWPDGVAGAV